jgi:cytochrome c oxidase assembly protein subunit 15
MSAAARPGAPSVASADDTAAVRAWLLVVALLVLAMIVVGGATRLTGSGLSITEWQPIVGIVPPLSDADWQSAFAKYREIPEYKLVNKGMGLAGFKAIYWWEWSHRLLGRLIGLVFALPLAWFWWRRRIPTGYSPALAGLLALGGLQGAIGWYMVQSGLVDRVDVSQYRLALHLTIAFLILAVLAWLWLDLRPAQPIPSLRTLSPWHHRGAAVVVALVLVQVVLGALVAGTKAGLTYNTWPLMDGRLVPNGLLTLSPWWLNAFENVTTIQFNHRAMAYVAVAVTLVVVMWTVRRADEPRVRRSAVALGMLVVAQAGLGIATLLAAEGAIPLALGLAHQAGAAVLLAVAVWHLHAVRAAVH